MTELTEWDALRVAIKTSKVFETPDSIYALMLTI